MLRCVYERPHLGTERTPSTRRWGLNRRNCMCVQGFGTVVDERDEVQLVIRGQRQHFNDVTVSMDVGAEVGGIGAVTKALGSVPVSIQTRNRGVPRPISVHNFIRFNNICNILRYLYEKPPHNNRNEVPSLFPSKHVRDSTFISLKVYAHTVTVP